MENLEISRREQSKPRYLGSDEEVFSCHSAVLYLPLDCLTNLSFILVVIRRIEMSNANVNGVLHRLLRTFGVWLNQRITSQLLKLSNQFHNGINIFIGNQAIVEHSARNVTHHYPSRSFVVLKLGRAQAERRHTMSVVERQIGYHYFCYFGTA